MGGLRFLNTAAPAKFVGEEIEVSAAPQRFLLMIWSYLAHDKFSSKSQL